MARDKLPASRDKLEPAANDRRAAAYRYSAETFPAPDASKIVGSNRIRAHNSSEAIPMRNLQWLPSTRNRGDDNVLFGKKARPTSFGHRNIDQRNNRAAQKLKIPIKVAGAKGKPRHDRPLQNFFHIQHRQTKSFAATTEDHIAISGWALFRAADSLSISAVVASGGSARVEFVVHKNQANLRTARKSSSRVKGWNVSIGRLVVPPILSLAYLSKSPENYRYGPKLRAAFQFAPDLEAVAFRLTLQAKSNRGERRNRLLDPQRIVQPKELKTLVVQQPPA